jgi:preprotein translocase subunit SecG
VEEQISWWAIVAFVLNPVLFLVSAFMVLLVLIQRGKGGGLIGALGGAGGSSPFGSRAGDQFTRLTIYVSIAWLLLIMIQVKAIQYSPNPFGQAGIAKTR